MAENNFETLSKNRNDFVRRLAFDDELSKIMINGNKKYKDNIVTTSDKILLSKNQILPYTKIMENITETKSYITMKFLYRKVDKLNYFKASQVTFYCFCHESLIFTDYQIFRYDAMLSCVDRLINDSESVNWIGTMKLDSMSDVVIDTKGNYIGVSVTYKNLEFQ